MSKFWKVQDSKYNTLIYIKDKTIYMGKPKQKDLQRLTESTTDLAFLETLFSLPYSYIKQIQNQQGTDYLNIIYGSGSEEPLHIPQKQIKKEVFDYLKTDLTGFRYQEEIPSVIKYGKPQFFALLFTSGISFWALYLAFQMEAGIAYELVGSGRSITGIVLGLAGIGFTNILIIYSVLLVIILFALMRKLKSRSPIEYLLRL